MPLSLIAGEAWEQSRELLARNYSDLVLISIVGATDDEMSFSADTGMGECLVIGRKTGEASTRATFVVLKERPDFPLLGATAAQQIRRLADSTAIARLEDGPIGGTPLEFGDDVVGYAISAPISLTEPWNPSRIADLSLAQSAYQLGKAGRIWLPGMQKSESVPVAVTTVERIAEIGPYHSDINGATAKGGIRGPFDIRPIRGNAVPTYPSLWAHDASRENTLEFGPDSEAVPKRGRNQSERELIDEKVASIGASASHAHFNQNFRFNSQPTAMQFTPRRAIGGRAWISIRLQTVAQEKALVVWANSSLGLVLHWYHANKQQAGRGNIGRTALAELPVLDVTRLAADQLARASRIFDDLRNERLLPFNELNRDAVRQELDRRLALEVLGLPASAIEAGGALDLLRKKLALEPSVQGGKGSLEDEQEDQVVYPLAKPGLRKVAEPSVRPKR